MGDTKLSRDSEMDNETSMTEETATSCSTVQDNGVGGDTASWYQWVYHFPSKKQGQNDCLSLGESKETAERISALHCAIILSAQGPAL